MVLFFDKIMLIFLGALLFLVILLPLHELISCIAYKISDARRVVYRADCKDWCFMPSMSVS